MEGKVLHYDEANESGILLCNDKKRYTFKKSDWLSQENPKPGTVVDFLAADNVATEIYSDTKEENETNVKNDLNSKKTIPLIVYILYLAAIINGLTLVVGAAVSYVYRSNGSDYVKSHYDYQIKVFWKTIIPLVLSFSISFIAMILGNPLFIFLQVVIVLVLMILLVVSSVRGISRLSKDLPIR
mgnify:CR=1 FL=1